jgi:hypothetical protein
MLIMGAVKETEVPKDATNAIRGLVDSPTKDCWPVEEVASLTGSVI